MDERRLARAFGLPFMPPTFIKLGDVARGTEQFAQKRFDYALGWGLDRDADGNKLPQTSSYLDVNRFIAGGDVLGQTTPEAGGRIAGLPAPLQPSGGLFGEIFIPMLGGIDPFTGKDILESDEADYWERFKFVVARLVPNNPLLGFSGLQKLFGSEERNDFYDSWSHKKIMNALEKRPDSSIDTQKLRAVHTVRYKQQIRELRELIRKKQQDVIEDYYGTPTYEKRQEKFSRYAAELIEKMEDIMIEARLVDVKRFKRRKREFGEVPLDVVESIGETVSEILD